MRLKVLPGGQHWNAPSLPLRPGRPGELLEPAPVTAGGQRLSEVAGQLRVDVDVAAALAAERSLLLSELGDDTDRAARVLDSHAHASVGTPIGAAEAAYLRSLQTRAAAQRRLDDCPSVRIPARLRRRVSELRFDALSEIELQQAVDWEQAAVLEGRTMSEWAWRTLLLASRWRGA
jgi:hypothetical protein